MERTLINPILQFFRTDGTNSPMNMAYKAMDMLSPMTGGIKSPRSAPDKVPKSTIRKR